MSCTPTKSSLTLTWNLSTRLILYPVRQILNCSAESHSHKMILVKEGGGVLYHMYTCIYYNVLRSIPDLKYSKNCIAFFVLVSRRILNLLYFVEQLYIFPISHKHHSDLLFIPMLQFHDVPFWRYSQTAMQVRNIRKIMCPNSIYAAK